MLTDEIKNIKSNNNEFRKFGLTVGLFLGLLTTLFLWRHKTYYYYLYLYIFSFGLIFSALFVPHILKYLHKVWMIFSLLLGWLMTRIILIFLFFIIITPIGFLVRTFNKNSKNSLNLKFDEKAESYWIPKEQVEFKKENFENQY